MSKPIEIFVSYAHKDRAYFEELKKHLVPLKRDGLIQLWYDAAISPGTDWKKEIGTHLNTAQAILLLISADFIASDYCYSVEMQRAMERHDRGEARVIPIILRTTDNWKNAPFGKLQALPNDARPIKNWRDKDEAFVSVVAGIREVTKNFSPLPSVDPQTLQRGEESVETSQKASYPEQRLSDISLTPITFEENSLEDMQKDSPRNIQDCICKQSPAIALEQVDQTIVSKSPPSVIAEQVSRSHLAAQSSSQATLDIHPLERGRVSRRVAIISLAALIAGGLGATWRTLAEISSQHSIANPLLLLYQGHHEAVWRVRWSLDGRRIASGGGDHTVQIWYAYSGRSFYTYYGHHNMNVRAIAWSPDSTHIASGGDDKTAQVWDVATGNVIYIYHGNANIVWDLAWSPDGSRIASAGWDKTVQVWNAQTGQHIYTYRGHSDTVRSIAWSPDSTRIASASRDLLVQVWEADTGRSVSSYSGHPTDTLMCVAWSPNGTYIASSGWDKTVQIWEAITGNHVYTYSGHTGVVMEVAWSHDSKRIASASTDKTVQVWEALTGSHAYIYRGHTSRVYSVTWSPDSKYLASSQDHAVHVWQPS